MPNGVTGTGNTFNLPNFAGELFTASPTRTPFLSMIGGLSGGRKTDNDRLLPANCMSSRNPPSLKFLNRLPKRPPKPPLSPANRSTT